MAKYYPYTALADSTTLYDLYDITSYDISTYDSPKKIEIHEARFHVTNEFFAHFGPTESIEMLLAKAGVKGAQVHSIIVTAMPQNAINEVRIEYTTISKHPDLYYQSYGINVSPMPPSQDDFPWYGPGD